jgi:hypothetical protein
LKSRPARQFNELKQIKRRDIVDRKVGVTHNQRKSSLSKVGETALSLLQGL